MLNFKKYKELIEEELDYLRNFLLDFINENEINDKELLKESIKKLRDFREFPVTTTPCLEAIVGLEDQKTCLIRLRQEDNILQFIDYDNENNIIELDIKKLLIKSMRTKRSFFDLSKKPLIDSKYLKKDILKEIKFDFPIYIAKANINVKDEVNMILYCYLDDVKLIMKLEVELIDGNIEIKSVSSFFPSRPITDEDDFYFFNKNFNHIDSFYVRELKMKFLNIDLGEEINSYIIENGIESLSSEDLNMLISIRTSS